LNQRKKPLSDFTAVHQIPILSTSPTLMSSLRRIELIQRVLITVSYFTTEWHQKTENLYRYFFWVPVLPLRLMGPVLKPAGVSEL
jgi:hypothetical protein